jgi:hypothetical protein
MSRIVTILLKKIPFYPICVYYLVKPKSGSELYMIKVLFSSEAWILILILLFFVVPVIVTLQDFEG